ncbi:MAG: hypothetical protein KAR35_06500 [Candidatus Heimdallarchaeota archaeon]|nr:hypothetical protein [Candidatus Heimdallarchaeota archaeon]MCK5049008.1 hypothetical protein [Candidatus Heimdallarchaeota archaeon]
MTKIYKKASKANRKDIKKIFENLTNDENQRLDEVKTQSESFDEINHLIDNSKMTCLRLLGTLQNITPHTESLTETTLDDIHPMKRKVLETEVLCLSQVKEDLINRVLFLDEMIKPRQQVEEMLNEDISLLEAEKFRFIEELSIMIDEIERWERMANVLTKLATLDKRYQILTIIREIGHMDEQVIAFYSGCSIQDVKKALVELEHLELINTRAPPVPHLR